MTNERQNDTRPAYGWKSNLIEKAIQLGCKQIYTINPFSTMGQRNKWHFIVKILKQYILKKIDWSILLYFFYHSTPEAFYRQGSWPWTIRPSRVTIKDKFWCQPPRIKPVTFPPCLWVEAIVTSYLNNKILYWYFNSFFDCI